MYYLYNPTSQRYIGKMGNRYISTSRMDDACLFEDKWSPQNILDNGNIPKSIPDREGFVILSDKPKEVVDDVKTDKKSIRCELSMGNGYSLDDVEAILKENTKKIKTIYSYLSNIMNSLKPFDNLENAFSNKVVLIYHYIESGACQTEEEKARINDLLERVLRIRRQAKQMEAVRKSITANNLVSEFCKLKLKVEPYEYWEFDFDEFIKMIETGKGEKDAGTKLQSSS